MKTTFTNGIVFTPDGPREGLEVTVDNGLIASVMPKGEHETGEVVNLDGRFLVAGFIDTQVNGGGGTLFNDRTDVEGITRIAAAHRQFGTTGMLPTLISDDLDVVSAGLEAVDAAIESGVPGVLGIHIEGPFLNPERRGIHDGDKVRSLTEDILKDLTPLNGGRTLLTLAPDTVSPRQIQELVARGFIISGGHSNATRQALDLAAGAGLTGITHLFNAMSQMQPREPGMVGGALADDRLFCGIIADGHHVNDQNLEIALRCKGRNRLMLVTDAMPTVGTNLGSFRLGEKTIKVHQGACFDDQGTLAGTHLYMAEAVRHIQRATQCPLADAFHMASSSPAEFLGLQSTTGAIRKGLRADLVITDPDLNIHQTWINGTPD